MQGSRQEALQISYFSFISYFFIPVVPILFIYIFFYRYFYILKRMFMKERLYYDLPVKFW